MRKLLSVLGIILVFSVGYLLIAYHSKTDLGDRVVSIIIQPGDSFQAVADQVLAAQIVKSRLMLDYPARIREIDKKLISGRYDFTGQNSCRSVLDKLEAGDFVRKKLTVYEGAPVWKVASLLSEHLEMDSALVMAFNSDTTFCASLGVPCLEGYLFPETYFIKWGTELPDILADMVGMYLQQTEGIWPDSIPNSLSHTDVIILASIIEAEAMLSEEMPQIASVYHNRLRRRMKLDADPTVIYGLGGLDRPLMRRDLRKETPYNTYRSRGLPPTPINSPGLKAIKAAIAPDSSEYLYFVADGSGGHRFSRTNAEHNRARRDIKKQMRSSGNSNGR
ncbi:MAG: endolytic transglycosylase MltG [candidate division Zixibacteria bacterium]